MKEPITFPISKHEPLAAETYIFLPSCLYSVLWSFSDIHKGHIRVLLKTEKGSHTGLEKSTNIQQSRTNDKHRYSGWCRCTLPFCTFHPETQNHLHLKRLNRQLITFASSNITHHRGESSIMTPRTALSGQNGDLKLCSQPIDPREILLSACCGSSPQGAEGLLHTVSRPFSPHALKEWGSN